MFNANNAILIINISKIARVLILYCISENDNILAVIICIYVHKEPNNKMKNN